MTKHDHESPSFEAAFAGLLLLLAGAGHAAGTESWHCRNDLELTCSPGACQVVPADSFTPMDVSVDDSGTMSVCAYSGCWQGVGELVRDTSFLIWIGHDLKWSSSDDSETAADVILAIDSADGVATFKTGSYVHPLLCQRDESAGLDPSAPAVRARIHPELPEYSFTLIGELDELGESFLAAGVEIRRGGAAEPLQVIEGIDTAIPMFADFLGLEVVDMNFDGYGDLRVMKSRTAGPNTTFLNWLFEPASARFVSSAELNAIVSPVFDRETRQITSSWRESAASYGIDTYSVVAGKPVLVRTERRRYTGPGVYHLTVSELTEGDWRIVEDEEVEETVETDE